MKSKILIFGATGAVGSSLAKLMSSGSGACHLIGKNEEEISKLSDETGHSYSIADVLDENFIEKIEQDVGEFEISGIAYWPICSLSPSKSLLPKIPPKTLGCKVLTRPPKIEG